MREWYSIDVCAHGAGLTRVDECIRHRADECVCVHTAGLTCVDEEEPNCIPKALTLVSTLLGAEQGRRACGQSDPQRRRGLALRPTRQS